MDQFRGKEKSANKRHEGFQSPNPMKMTAFEESLAIKEKKDRQLARVRYNMGIQGCDGGSFPGRDPS